MGKSHRHHQHGALECHPGRRVHTSAHSPVVEFIPANLAHLNLLALTEAQDSGSPAPEGGLNVSCSYSTCPLKEHEGNFRTLLQDPPAPAVRYAYDSSCTVNVMQRIPCLFRARTVFVRPLSRQAGTKIFLLKYGLWEHKIWQDKPHEGSSYPVEVLLSNLNLLGLANSNAPMKKERVPHPHFTATIYKIQMVAN